MKQAGITFKLRGYVEAELSGGIPKAFFNHALAGGIAIKNMRNFGTKIRFYVLASEYKKLRKAAKQSGSRLRVAKKRGLPFIINKIMFPLPLAVGICIMCTVVFLLGNIAFTITIAGDSTISKSELMASLNEYGLHIGVLKGAINGDEIINKTLIKYDRLAWMAINPHFGAIEVQIWDKIIKAEHSVDNSDAYICTKIDAQIKTIEITSGTAVVKVGEVVSRGQPLVIPSEFAIAGSWTTAVKAKVIGFTSYENSFEQSRTITIRQKTKNKKTFYGLSFVSKDNLYFIKPSCKYQYYDVEEYTKSLSIFGVELPIRIAVTELYEINQETKMLDLEEAKPYLLEKQKAFEKQVLSFAKVMNRSNNYLEIDGKFVLNAEYLCEEDIGLCICP